MPSTPLHEPAKRPLELIEEAERQWLYTEDELLRTPSICDGMKAEEERALRSKGVNFITQVGIMLRLSQTTLGTAAVFFNRFLMRRSLVDKDGVKALHHYQVAAVSVFLATKVKEHVRKVKELVIACCRIAQKNPNLLVDEQTKDFWRWRDSILYNEDQLLEWLCFDLTIESPYEVLLELIKYYPVAGHSKKARETAWGFVNDSHLTQMCLLFPAKVIACAALYAGCKTADIALEDENGQPWWITQQVALRNVRRAVNYIAEWYSRSQPLKPSQGEEVYRGLQTPEHGSEDGAKTRLKENVSQLASPARSTSASVTAMERSGSQQSLKRRREDDTEGEYSQVVSEEAEKVQRSDEENSQREASDRSRTFPRVPGTARTPAARTPAVAGASTNGAGPAPWARKAGEPAAKKARVGEEPSNSTSIPLRPTENGHGDEAPLEASEQGADDDDAEEGEVDE